MQTKILKPSPKYLTKMRTTMFLMAALVMLSGVVVGLILSLEGSIGFGGLVVAVAGTFVLNVLWWVPALLLAGAYYRSLSYEIQDDEVIVHAGIVTRSVKHVPYRTVTNLTVKRDPLDRWFFGLGTLNIQTAGMSGQTGAEESLVGLPNVQEVYELVAAELRRFRGSMAPTMADMDAEVEPATASASVMNSILAEVRSIRQVLEER